MDTVDNSYKIRTALFEGPLGVLLSLVEKRKLFINDFSLSQVTEDYLNYINNLEKKDSTEISSFIVIAATLILIKSKSLLPNLELTDEEQSDIKNLEERLRLYEIFVKFSQNVKNIFGRKIIFAPMERKNIFGLSMQGSLVFLPDDKITKESMMVFARNVLGAMPKKSFLPEVEVKKVISIEEMIDKLTDRIQNSMRTNFKEFTGKSETREERLVVIVGFLAMLELVRQGILNARQEEDSSEIIIEKQQEILTNINHE